MYNMSPYSLSRSFRDKPCRAVIYGRASTEHEAQVKALQNQMQWYDDVARFHPQWNVINRYIDQGITGTQVYKRDAFMRMMEDAKQQKFDLIVTREVCRFARNTVDALVCVRQLAAIGIEVYFVNDNIWTLDGDGELRLTIMATMAQEESRSISENVTWGHRKRFADGKVSLAFTHFLGYDKGMDGNLVVNKKQAEIVKLIYRLYLNGYTFHSIAKELTERKIPTPAGCKIWRANTIRSILMNEKYKGDALLQKKITVDFLTKETKKNEGEVPQYYVEHNHEAIISPQVFDWVQEEIKRRRKRKKRYSGVSIFSSKIKCGQCGGWYGAKVWHSTDKYRRTIYRCNDKFKNHCQTPHLTENEIKGAFIRAVNQLIENKEDILSNITMLKKRLTDTASLEKERDALELDLNMLTDQVQQLIAENAQVAQDQDEYGRKYNGLVSRYEETKKKYDQVCDAIQQCVDRYWKLDNFMKNLQKQNLVYEFDERLWCSLVDFIIVYSKVKIQIVFKNGTKIHVGM